MGPSTRCRPTFPAFGSGPCVETISGAARIRPRDRSHRALRPSRGAVSGARVRLRCSGDGERACGSSSVTAAPLPASLSPPPSPGHLLTLSRHPTPPPACIPLAPPTSTSHKHSLGDSCPAAQWPGEPAESGQISAGEASIGSSGRHVEIFQMGGVGTSILWRPRSLPGPPTRRPAPHSSTVKSQQRPGR